MIVPNLQTTIQFDLWVLPANDEQILDLGPVKLEPNWDSGEYTVIKNGQPVEVALREGYQKNDLNFYYKRGYARFARIVQTAKDGSALLRVNFFAGDLVELGEIEIGIDEKILATARNINLKFRNADDLVQLLKEKVTIKPDNSDEDDYFVMIVGAAADEDFDDEEIPLSDKSARNLRQAKSFGQQMRCFSLYGDGLRIPVERRKIDQYNEIFFATRLNSKQGNNTNAPLRLAKGKIRFADYTKTGRIRALASGTMMRLIQEQGSYLKQWDQFGAVEGELLLETARKIGKLEYTNCQPDSRGVIFFFDKPLPKELTETDQLEITSELPVYLADPELTWAECTRYLEEEFKEKAAQSNDKPEAIYAKILELGSKSLILDIPPTIPDNGNFLVLSINGEMVQIERRMKARKLILEGRSANPLLGLIIEENGILPETQRVTKLKPLTPFVREKIFKHDPTPAQVAAIEIALNTPDIALIQGPPGTGKTTVITAILERLNEEQDKIGSIKGKVLVSGFQHDAVENIITRLSINSLPPVKFGRRSGESEMAGDKVRKRIELWCQDIVRKIRAKNPQLKQTEDQRQLGELFILYNHTPSLNNALNLLKRILLLPRNVLTSDLVEKTTMLLDHLTLEDQSGQYWDKEALRIIRAFRISREGLLDDGRERAMDILGYFNTKLTDLEKQVMKRAICWQEGTKPDFLPELKDIKSRLLDVYMPRPQYNIEKPREDLLDLFIKVSRQLENQKDGFSKTQVILADFLHELEDNPDGAREAIEAYNYVYAATTQQAEGYAIRDAKTSRRGELISYDTVIVDEAARTSPRDLLIPMAQAEKRIILVGDHRQLPHLVNEEVAKRLEDEESDENPLNTDFVNQSMFQYLFHRIKKLEKSDGIFRTVTLDAQYRMHPLLGQFVSKNFYEPYKEGFSSPLPEHLFSHYLPDTGNKAAVWINVPNNNDEEKRGNSWYRTAEAQVIAERLKKWMDSDQGKNLSFGVISFYQAQTKEIYEQLYPYGITKRSSDGHRDVWEIADEYKYLTKDKDSIESKDRLCIGTVDAFQGMEFDVVFLSVVRSQGLKVLAEKMRYANNLEKIKRGVFGHLLSENRLCVSMSRQKRLLVVVGDEALIQTKFAKEAVPALESYWQLCRKNGVIL